jgi:VanZ family protein
MDIWVENVDMKAYIRMTKLVMVVLMLLFIWGNSLLPASVSSTESGYVEQLVRPILLPIQALLGRAGIVVTLSQLVRKMAHFTEYTVLGVMMSVLFVRPNGRGRFFLSEFLCLAAAMVDEGIQLFSEGRGASLRDVAIDFSGATLGILAVTAVLLMFRLCMYIDRKVM